MKNNILFTVFIFSLLCSCSKKKCNIIPISGLAIDTTKIANKAIPYKSIDGMTANLTVKGYYNSYRENSIKTLMNHRECSHSIGLEYEFKNETLNIRIDKTNDDEFHLSLFNHYFD